MLRVQTERRMTGPTLNGSCSATVLTAHALNAPRPVHRWHHSTPYWNSGLPCSLEAACVWFADAVKHWNRKFFPEIGNGHRDTEHNTSKRHVSSEWATQLLDSLEMWVLEVINLLVSYRDTILITCVSVTRNIQALEKRPQTISLSQIWTWCPGGPCYVHGWTSWPHVTMFLFFFVSSSLH